jgi:hypothetical protein
MSKEALWAARGMGLQKNAFPGAGSRTGLPTSAGSALLRAQAAKRALKRRKKAILVREEPVFFIMAHSTKQLWAKKHMVASAVSPAGQIQGIDHHQDCKKTVVFCIFPGYHKIPNAGAGK